MSSYGYSDVVVVEIVALALPVVFSLLIGPRLGKLFVPVPMLSLPMAAFAVPLAGSGLRKASTDGLAHAATAGFLGLMLTGGALYFAMGVAVPLGERLEKRRDERTRARFGLRPAGTDAQGDRG